MNDLKTIIEKLNALPDNVSALAISVLDDEQIAVMQRRLEQGVKASGESLPEYTPFTLQLKRASGGFISPSGNIALKDTGSFYNSMKLDKRQDYAEIASSDSISSELAQRYGDDILDVSDEESSEMIAQKEDELAIEIEKYLFE